MNTHKNLIAVIALAAFLTAVPCTSGEPRPAVPVYVEPTAADGGQFSGLVKVELAKRRGLIKANVDVVRSPDRAVYIIEINVANRRPSWHEGVFTREQATVMASVIAYDQCGRMVWSKTKGDRNELTGDPYGAIYAAEKIAASFKEALAKKKSRLNRAHPCASAVPSEDSGRLFGSR